MTTFHAAAAVIERGLEAAKVVRTSEFLCGINHMVMMARMEAKILSGILLGGLYDLADLSLS